MTKKRRDGETSVGYRLEKGKRTKSEKDTFKDRTTQSGEISLRTRYLGERNTL